MLSAGVAQVKWPLAVLLYKELSKIQICYPRLCNNPHKVRQTNSLTPWIGVLLEVHSHSDSQENCFTFYGSLPCSQESATGLYLEPDESRTHSHSISLISILILSSLPPAKAADFPTKILY